MRSMYSFIRPALFRLTAESAHDLTLNSLATVARIAPLNTLVRYCYAKQVDDLPVRLMGLDFRHPVGLAAGLDKNAQAFKAFSALGFSAVEMGTVTPRPQPGNNKPRMFRLTEDHAIINRMGFNSGGLKRFLQNLTTDDSAIVGINIGKNKITPNDSAIDDYLSALTAVYTHADYVTVNISSPNTAALRELQNREPLNELLTAIKQQQQTLHEQHQQYTPIALKIAPDLSDDDIATISELLLSHKFDALIATNTTVARPSTLQNSDATESGGLSGAPLKHAATKTIRGFYQHLQGTIPIIGVGGIETADDAWEKLLAGADFLQIYSGLIYHGPAMIRHIVQGLQRIIAQQGFDDLPSALAQLR